MKYLITILLLLLTGCRVQPFGGDVVITDNLKLKTTKDKIIDSQEFVDEKGTLVIAYSYKSDEIASVLDNEIIEQRTPHIVYRNLGDKKRSAQSGFNFYKDGDNWKQIKFATTTKDAYEKQTVSFWDKFIAWATDTAATSPGTMANDAAVGDTAWSSPDNAKTLNSVYTMISVSTSNATSNYLKATNFGFSITAGSTINGILVQSYEDTGSTAGVTGTVVKIIKADASLGTTNKARGAWADSPAYYDYGANNDLWGESWTAENINDIDFGVAMAVSVVKYFNTAYIDHIKITITYTEGAGGGTTPIIQIPALPTD